MSEARKTAQRIFREWCEGNGVATDPVCAADLVSRIASEIDGLRAQIAATRSTLEWMNRKGGLGLDVHDRIREVLSTLAQGPAGQSEALDEKKLLARVAAIICEETCGLTSECKSREAAKALLDKGYLSAGSAPPGVTAARAPDEATELALRSRARKLLTNKGWTPGSNISLHSAIELLTAFGMELSRAPETDRCAYPECGCDFDATCNAALPTVKVSGDAAEMRERAAKLADALAAKQRETNEKYPDHAKAYQSWRTAVSLYEEVAAAIRALPLTPEGRS